MLDDQDTPQMDACATFPAIGRALQLIANIPAWHVGAFLTVSGRLNASFCAATGESPADVDFLQNESSLPLVSSGRVGFVRGGRLSSGPRVVAGPVIAQCTTGSTACLCSADLGMNVRSYRR